jgi:hypothetical protein
MLILFSFHLAARRLLCFVVLVGFHMRPDQVLSRRSTKIEGLNDFKTLDMPIYSESPGKTEGGNFFCFGLAKARTEHFGYENASHFFKLRKNNHSSGRRFKYECKIVLHATSAPDPKFSPVFIKEKY